MGSRTLISIGCLEKSSQRLFVSDSIFVREKLLLTVCSAMVPDDVKIELLKMIKTYLDGVVEKAP